MIHILIRLILKWLPITVESQLQIATYFDSKEFDNLGFTHLHLAAKRNYIEFGKILIENASPMPYCLLVSAEKSGP